MTDEEHTVDNVDENKKNKDSEPLSEKEEHKSEEEEHQSSDQLQKSSKNELEDNKIENQEEESKSDPLNQVSMPDLLRDLEGRPCLEKLQELGYQIYKENDNDFGKLRQIKDDKAGLKWEGQQHYDFLADTLTEYVQEKMKEQLQELLIPEDKDLEEDYHHLPRCNIFLNKDFQDSGREKALILIQGTGAVRAGVWARSVCMNESLEKGSVLPFLEVAKKNNIDVLVMNPNYNRDPKTKETIPYCHSMEAHAKFVWDHYVKDTKHTELYIVAHSAGGSCLASIQREFKDTFYKRVKKIALTDSWTIEKSSLTKDQAAFMKENCVHYVASSLPVGEPIGKSMRSSVCLEVSAGHQKHEYTTGYAFDKLIEQFGFDQ